MSMKPETKQDLYKQVTEKLIVQMEAGVCVWQQPWVSSNRFQPMNGVTERLYKGWNRMYLGLLQYELGTEDPRWFTYKSAAGVGGQVRKGEKSTTIVYNKPITDKADPDKKFWLLAFHKVFHASQCDGLPVLEDVVLPEQERDCDFEGVHKLEGWIGENLKGYEPDGDRACYYPSRDTIEMPPPESFHKASWWLQTLAHEVIHSTKGEGRLNRRDVTEGKYAKEELVAEFGAAMLCGMFGVEPDLEQSASYLRGWADKCREEPSLLVSAANAAERACDYVYNGIYVRECV